MTDVQMLSQETSEYESEFFERTRQKIMEDAQTLNFEGSE